MFCRVFDGFDDMVALIGLYSIFRHDWPNIDRNYLLIGWDLPKIQNFVIVPAVNIHLHG